MFPIIKKWPIETKKGLYCVWIRQNERPGAPLVAVWIDPSMKCFHEGGETKEHSPAKLTFAMDYNGEGDRRNASSTGRESISRR